MRTRPLTNGTLEPVTLDELKPWMRISSGDIEDANLKTILAAARRACEEFGRMSISPRQWLTIYRVPRYSGNALVKTFTVTDPDNVTKRLTLRRRPAISVETIEFKTRDASEYATPDHTLDLAEGTIVWHKDLYLADANLSSIQVTYTAGFPANAESEPTHCVADENVKLAVMETALHFYEDRGLDDTMSIPQKAMDLLRGYWQPAGAY